MIRDSGGPWQPLVSCLELHPNFCSSLLSCLEILYYGVGPLPAHHRHYIALMAACRHHCEFFVKLHCAEFVKLGGNEEWLKGVAWAPAKLQALDELNRILAHQPWKADASHIRELCRVSSQQNWSLNELVWAILILARSHTLCSLAHACGVHSQFNLQQTLDGVAEQPVSLPRCTYRTGARSPFRKPSPASPRSRGASRTGNHQRALLGQLNELKIAQGAPGNAPLPSGVRESSKDDDDNDKQCDLRCARLTFHLDYRYEDFYTRTNHTVAPILKIHDFNWSSEGFGVISQLVDNDDMVDAMDQGFSTAQKLTYKRMGTRDGIDTTKYRLAMWNYVLNLFGIHHDDYDYAMVNRLLDRRMKTFIKTVACYPERTTIHLRQIAMMNSEFSEMVHSSFLISEARLQVSLLYICRALADFMA